MLSDAHAEVRWTAAEVLGRIGHEGDSAALMLLLGDRVGEVRRQAALALGYLGASGTRAALSERAAADADRRVRVAAAYALSTLP